MRGLKGALLVFLISTGFLTALSIVSLKASTIENLVPDRPSCLGALLAFSEKQQLDPRIAKANTDALIKIVAADFRLETTDRSRILDFLTSLENEPNVHIEIEVGYQNIQDRLDVWAHLTDEAFQNALSHPVEFIMSGYFGDRFKFSNIPTKAQMRWNKYVRRGTSLLAIAVLTWLHFDNSPWKDSLSAEDKYLATMLAKVSSISLLTFNTLSEILLGLIGRKLDSVSRTAVLAELKREDRFGTARNSLLDLRENLVGDPQYLFWDTEYSAGLISFLKERLNAKDEWFQGSKGRRQLIFISTTQAGEPIMFYAAGGL